MRDLVSLGDQTFYGRQRKKGETFRALNTDADMLIAIGHAALAPEKVMVQPQTQTKQVQSRAIEAAKSEEDQEQTRSRRSYRRRDMSAENQTEFKGSDTPTTEPHE